VSGRVRRGLVTVGTCSTRSGKCRYMFGDVGLVSGLVQRSGNSVIDVFTEVVLVSELVRRGWVSVGTCHERSVYCRDMFGEVGLVSGRVRRCRLSVGTCSARSD